MSTTNSPWFKGPTCHHCCLWKIAGTQLSGKSKNYHKLVIGTAQCCHSIHFGIRGMELLRRALWRKGTIYDGSITWRHLQVYLPWYCSNGKSAQSNALKGLQTQGSRTWSKGLSNYSSNGHVAARFICLTSTTSIHEEEEQVDDRVCYKTDLDKRKFSWQYFTCRIDGRWQRKEAFSGSFYW